MLLQIGGMRLAFDSRQDQYDRLVDATLDDAGGASLRSYSGDILLLTSSYVARGEPAGLVPRCTVSCLFLF